MVLELGALGEQSQLWWGQGLLEREQGNSSAPFPITAPFSLQSHRPLFLLAALLQAVYAKNHHFFVKLF